MSLLHGVRLCCEVCIFTLYLIAKEGFFFVEIYFKYGSSWN